MLNLKDEIIRIKNEVGADDYDEYYDGFVMIRRTDDCELKYDSQPDGDDWRDKINGVCGVNISDEELEKIENIKKYAGNYILILLSKNIESGVDDGEIVMNRNNLTVLAKYDVNNIEI